MRDHPSFKTTMSGKQSVWSLEGDGCIANFSISTLVVQLGLFESISAIHCFVCLFVYLFRPFKSQCCTSIGKQATKLDPMSKKLTLDSGVEISYDKCLLATGGKPRNLPLFSDAPPSVKEKVSLYRSIPDFLKMDKLVDSVGSILVVGGGFLGSELAVGMASRGEEVACDLSLCVRQYLFLGMCYVFEIGGTTAPDLGF